MSSQSPRRIVTIALYIGLCAFLAVGGYRVGEQQGLQKNSKGSGSYNVPASTKTSDAQKSALNENEKNVDFGLFWEAWDIFEKRFADREKLDTTKMFYGAIKGLVSSGDDPYTFFLTPEENEQSKDSLGGKFEGIGAQLGTKDGRIVVIAPIKNSPAIRAGIRAGDVIDKVDDVSTKGKNITEVVSKIRGPAGTDVKLDMERNGKPLTFTIRRAQIQVDSVELTYTGQYAHLKLSQFGTTIREEWNRAADEVAEAFKSGKVKGLVLDLRGNPGGLLEACVYIAGDFLPFQTLVVKQVGIEDTIEYKVNNRARLEEIPVVVLIDKGSASASEILAGTLRDHKRAQLVGEKSFGKGSVQGTYDLSNGSGMHVTVAKWILPNGEWINGKGIEPNVKVENPEVDSQNTVETEKNDKQLQKALEMLKKR